MSDEQLMDALKNRASLVESFTDFEVEIIERMGAELKRLNPNRVSHYDAILDESVIKHVMT